MKALTFTILVLFSAIAANDLASDTMAVRAILDSNGCQGFSALDEMFVLTADGRITEFAMRGVQHHCDPQRDTLVLPSDIGALSALKFLDCGWMVLPSLPEAIGRLQNLEVLSIEYNRAIRTLPDSLVELRKLKTIFGQYAGLTSLPREIGRCTSLTDIDVPDCYLSDLPTSITNLTSTSASVHDNRLCSLDTIIAAWCDQYSPGWRETQDCTPVRRPFVRSSSAVGIQPNTPVEIHDILGRVLAAGRYKEVLPDLLSRAHGTYILILPDRDDSGQSKVLVGP